MFLYLFLSLSLSNHYFYNINNLCCFIFFSLFLAQQTKCLKAFLFLRKRKLENILEKLALIGKVKNIFFFY